MQLYGFYKELHTRGRKRLSAFNFINDNVRSIKIELDDGKPEPRIIESPDNSMFRRHPHEQNPIEYVGAKKEIEFGGKRQVFEDTFFVDRRALSEQLREDSRNDDLTKITLVWRATFRMLRAHLTRDYPLTQLLGFDEMDYLLCSAGFAQYHKNRFLKEYILHKSEDLLYRSIDGYLISMSCTSLVTKAHNDQSEWDIQEICSLLLMTRERWNASRTSSA